MTWLDVCEPVEYIISWTQDSGFRTQDLTWCVWASVVYHILDSGLDLMCVSQWSISYLGLRTQDSWLDLMCVSQWRKEFLHLHNCLALKKRIVEDIWEVSHLSLNDRRTSCFRHSNAAQSYFMLWYWAIDVEVAMWIWSNNSTHWADWFELVWRAAHFVLMSATDWVLFDCIWMQEAVLLLNRTVPLLKHVIWLCSSHVIVW